MKTINTAIVAVLALIAIAAAPANAAAQSISAQIDSMLELPKIKKSDTGVMIYNITKDKVVYAEKADNLFRPASVQKLLCIITALEYIPKERQYFSTSLHYTGNITDNGTLIGDLYVKGGFDPEFSTSDLESLAEAVANSGIKEIDGNIYGDISMTDGVFWGEGWCWDDCKSSFQPYMSPLMVNKGCVTVKVIPTKDGGCKLQASPESDMYTLERGGDNGMPEIKSDWMHRTNTITVSGRFRRQATRQICMYPSQDFFMSAFERSLAAHGITADERSFKSVPDNAVLLHEMKRPMSEAIHEAMKESDNLSAEAVLFKLAELNRTKKASRKDGTSFINKMIGRLGFNPKDFRIKDGCGLSLYDYISPSLLVSFLNHAYHDTYIKENLYKQLPIAGRDGTLKHRMKKGYTVNNVHAKTGSVTGVSSLAGYMTDKDGDMYSFAIISQGIFPTSAARKLQDKICEIICGSGNTALQ